MLKKKYMPVWKEIGQKVKQENVIWSKWKPKSWKINTIGRRKQGLFS